MIPFRIPSDFAADVAMGRIVRYGAILKDAQTGRIVAHVQETGLFHSVLSQGLGLASTAASVVTSPVSAVTGVVSVVQNEQIKRRLAELQSMMGTMMSLQWATLGVSVVGVGVTAVSTAILLQRMRKLEDGLEGIDDRVRDLPHGFRDLGLRGTLRDAAVGLERLEEVRLRQDPEPVLRQAEEKLHYAFNHFREGAGQIVVQARIDADLLRDLLIGMGLCATAQIKALYMLNEAATAGSRAARQFDSLSALTLLMPQDVLEMRLEDAASADELSAIAREGRARLASVPALSGRLDALEIGEQDYMARVDAEGEKICLMLPA